MSTDRIQEAIERDVAAAAADDAPEADEPETPPEPEQAPAPKPMNEKELAAVGKKIDAENERHEKRLRELYGDAFEAMRPCPLCLTEGYVPPLPPEGLAQEQLDAVREASGEAEGADLQMLEGVEECPKCKGYGVVQTPSRNEANRVKNCLECDSRGYRVKIEPAPPYAPPYAVQITGSGFEAPAPVPGELDAWSRPYGHPHYGIAPALVQ